jgi:hypothetical protein
LDRIGAGETREIAFLWDKIYLAVDFYNASEYLMPYIYDHDPSMNVRRNMISNMGVYGLVHYDYKNYFFAFAEGYVPQAMEGQEYEVSGNAMVLKEFEMQATGEGQRIMTDLRSITYVMEGRIDQYNDYSRSEDRLATEEAIIEYRFDEGFLAESIMANYGIYGYVDQVDIYFYNCGTDSYDKVFAAEEYVDLSSYIGEENTLTVKLRQRYSESANGYVPAFIVFGKDI